MAKAGLYVLDGKDGGGKTTLVEMLTRNLADEGYSIINSVNPYMDSSGKLLRERLKPRNVPIEDKSIEARTDAAMFFYNRVLQNANVIKPSIKKGVNVISDRYNMSTLLFQWTQGNDIGDLLYQYDSLTKSGAFVKPEVNIVLDVDPEVAYERLKQTKKPLEKFENIDFQKRLTENYRELVKIMKGREKIALVDANGPLEEVYRSVYNVMKGYLGAPA